MGYSGQLRFYELDHESKMRLLKTHSRTSNGLAMKPGTREEKQLKKTQTLQQGKSRPSKPAAYRRCSGGGQERLYGKPTTEKVLSMARRALVDMERNTGDNTREKSCENFPRAIGMPGGQTRKRHIPGMEGGNTYSLASGGNVWSKKQSRTSTTHKR